jgi:hypothetical protein
MGVVGQVRQVVELLILQLLILQLLLVLMMRTLRLLPLAIRVAAGGWRCCGCDRGRCRRGWVIQVKDGGGVAVHDAWRLMGTRMGVEMQKGCIVRRLVQRGRFERGQRWSADLR